MAIFIGEVKTKSPYKTFEGLSWMERWHLANEHADWISIHTDPRWGGSFKFLKWACKNTTKPVLAKGIHATNEEIQQALDCGASHVLVVGRVPPEKYREKCLLELTFGQFVCVAGHLPKQKYVHNLRDLTTGLPKKYNDFDLWKENFNNVWLCQASCIYHKYMVNPKADAFLVGENLPQFVESL